MISEGVTHRFVHIVGFGYTSRVYVLQDLLAQGASLATILRAGQWKSAAFLKYVEEAELEMVPILFNLL